MHAVGWCTFPESPFGYVQMVQELLSSQDIKICDANDAHSSAEKVLHIFLQAPLFNGLCAAKHVNN